VFTAKLAVCTTVFAVIDTTDPVALNGSATALRVTPHPVSSATATIAIVIFK